MTSRRQCAAGLDPLNLYNTLTGCTDGIIKNAGKGPAKADTMGATSRRQCAAGLDPLNLYNTLPGCKDGINSFWDIKRKVGARGLEPPNLTDVNRAL